MWTHTPAIGWRAFEGQYVGLEGGDLEVREPSGVIQTVRFDDVRAIEVEAGSHWPHGLVVGLLFDVLLAVVIVDGFYSMH